MPIHKNIQDDQARQILAWYEAGTMTKLEAQVRLGVRDTQFYTLLKAYRSSPKQFTVAYKRKTSNNSLPSSITARIRHELAVDQRLIDNPAMPIMFHNYSSIRDAVEANTGHCLSAQTVINYAKKWGYYIERPKKRAHSREVITDFVGMLLQHDTSTHQWSPYAVDSRGRPVKWSLITTLDDHSRSMLYSELFERETAWAHILALESVILNYGIGIDYYADNHSIFRYVANRDQQIHLNRVLGTDDVAPQWKQCVEAAGMKVIYAMSPEAKGKIERPYKWLQDRIVRRSARQGAGTIDEVRQILYDEVDRYNNRQVHSTTKEIPSKRFKKAVEDNRSCFKPFNIHRASPPVISTKDIFCLRAQRKVNGYGRISIFSLQLDVPGRLPDGTEIALHIVPDKQTTEIRFLRNDIVLGYTKIPTPPQLRF